MTPRDPDFFTKVPRSKPVERPSQYHYPTEEEVFVHRFPFLTRIPEPSKIFYDRENEVGQVMETMMKKRMRNCVIVGPAGVGKTEIARKAIQGIRQMGIFLSLDLSTLVSGCTLVGKFEERINELLSNAKTFKFDHPNLVFCLFIDEIHSLWNLNKHDKIGTVPAGDILKPYLADGTINIIGTTTNPEYEEYIKPDKALLRRISPVFVKPLDDEKSLTKILKKFCAKELSDELIKECIKASSKVKYLSNPDASIEIADRVMARALFQKRIANSSDVNQIVSVLMEGNDGEV